MQETIIEMKAAFPDLKHKEHFKMAALKWKDLQAEQQAAAKAQGHAKETTDAC